MLSDRVLQNILTLNDREHCSYENVFNFGIWRRFLFSNHKIGIRGGSGNTLQSIGSKFKAP